MAQDDTAPATADTKATRAKTTRAKPGAAKAAATKTAAATKSAAVKKVESAAQTAATTKTAAAGKASAAKTGAASIAADVKENASAFAASARELAAHTDVNEIAASTTSLIDTARPFFLAAFAVVFTVLGFFENNHGASVAYVLGAIIFVLAAGFSDELDQVLSRRNGGS